MAKNKLCPYLNLTSVCGRHWPQPQSQTPAAGAGPSFSGGDGKDIENNPVCGFFMKFSMFTSGLPELSDMYPKA